MQIEYKNIIDKSKIIDIRNNIKYELHHIPNAINISKNELMFNTENYLNKKDTYYIYCDKGIISKGLVNYLDIKGYNVVNIIGGYESYKLQIKYIK